ncbi:MULTISPECIES: RNA polymerase sigma factor [Bacillus]|uniref:RNA polymerase sigma factor n=1 Tax=Bacillus TaxID=1386 RepID=UPI00030B5229|nr:MULTISPECIES: sigma-70 family RNA polymerase sigma factor [Bacillus]
MKNDDLENVFSRYYHEVYLYAFFLCKNQSLAEDLVSETFFKAFISLDNVDDRIKFWLLRVCKNIWIDLVRRRKKLSDTMISEEMFVSDEVIINQIVQDEKKKTILKTVFSLPNSYKEAILLYYYLDLSLHEVAEALGISDGAARALLYRARKKMKTILREEDL